MNTPILIFCLSLFAAVLYFAWRSLQYEQATFFAKMEASNAFEQGKAFADRQIENQKSANRARIQRQRHIRQDQKLREIESQTKFAMQLAASGRKEPMPMENNLHNPWQRKEEKYIANLPKKKVIEVESPAEPAATANSEIPV